jgi:hypothetical protein
MTQGVAPTVPPSVATPPLEDPAEEPLEELAEEPVEELTEEPLEDPLEDPPDDPVVDPSGDPLEASAKELPEEPLDEPLEALPELLAASPVAPPPPVSPPHPQKPAQALAPTNVNAIPSFTANLLPTNNDRTARRTGRPPARVPHMSFTLALGGSRPNDGRCLRETGVPRTPSCGREPGRSAPLHRNSTPFGGFCAWHARCVDTRSCAPSYPILASVESFSLPWRHARSWAASFAASGPLPRRSSK